MANRKKGLANNAIAMPYRFLNPLSFPALAKVWGLPGHIVQHR
jgi:hypothetical protein